MCIRTSQVLKGSLEFSHCNSNNGLIPRKSTDDLAGGGQVSFAYCCHSGRKSETAPGTRPGTRAGRVTCLASRMWWIQHPVFWETANFCFRSPVPKATREEVQWPCWGPASRATQTGVPRSARVPAERRARGPGGRGQRKSHRPSPANSQTPRLDKLLLFSALNLGVVCSTEINNWKINTALKGCL